ncbi:FAD-dependent monooxygenase [Phyllobacterium sp. 21LDTY02-6]|uniref:FAD-dependent monooxygenase n=1 Tax=Phyllobacterium sp. 21LDTY02-6 TaxID=2944903 RepID=UPI002021E26E|nr:FAD-dependent monooxygenase [Phyllobacterium sp. 21LDTY02-6]MCO4319697.1 FAD-dependent monooxygenase [Phyllobacterium sp. 21LDTY02-6]
MNAALIDLKKERNRRDPNPEQIIIAGAGIAGLTLAIALAAKGFSVQIFEKSEALAEIGAGLQLSPNATRLLDRLDVLRDLGPRCVEPDAISLNDGRTGSVLLRLPMAEHARERWGAPYLACHRADLQNALLQRARRDGRIAIQLRSAVMQYESDAGSVIVRVQYDDRIEEHRAALLVGADGVWSAIRNVQDHHRARPTGTVAWRASVPAGALPASFKALLAESPEITAWTGPDAHLIAYPVRSGDMINFVAVAPDRHDDRPRARAEPDLGADFSGWHAAILGALRSAGPWTPWQLFEMRHCRFKIGKRLVLIGDAAHAMPPYAAQGAAMAIEDACALAALLGQNRDVERVLEQFSAQRTGRVEAVARRGALNRLAYHARGPMALARNTLLRMRKPEKFLEGLDWLYGYDAEARNK